MEQGKKMAALEHSWLTIVRIASFPFFEGRPVIRSIAILSKGLASGKVGIQ